VSPNLKTTRCSVSRFDLFDWSSGGYAFVYAVEDVDTGKMYALKRMMCQDEMAVKLADKEIRLMVCTNAFG
jgi:hypothetical protein